MTRKFNRRALRKKKRRIQKNKGELYFLVVVALFIVKNKNARKNCTSPDSFVGIVGIRTCSLCDFGIFVRTHNATPHNARSVLCLHLNAYPRCNFPATLFRFSSTFYLI